MFEDGHGVKRNYKEAIRLYRLSAKQGNKFARSRLSTMVKNERGVKENKKEAKRLFRLAAKTVRKTMHKK